MLPLDIAGRRRPGWLGDLIGTVGLNDRLGTGRTSCPAASSSGSRSPARWSAARRWSSRTSRPGTSTPQRRRGAGPAPPSVREFGQTVVMVTHDPVAPSYADRVIFLADGGIAGGLPTHARVRARRDEEPGGVPRCSVPCSGACSCIVCALILTGLAIALGVAFMSGSFVFSCHPLRLLTRSSPRPAPEPMSRPRTRRRAAPRTGSRAPAATRPRPAMRSARAGRGGADGRVIRQRGAAEPRPATAAGGSFGVALSWPTSPVPGDVHRRTGSRRPPGQVMIDRASPRRAIRGRRHDRLRHRRPRGALTVTGITGYGADASAAGRWRSSPSAPPSDCSARPASTTGSWSGPAPGIARRSCGTGSPAVCRPARRRSPRSARPARPGDQQPARLCATAARLRRDRAVRGTFVIWNTFSIMVGQRTGAGADLGARRERRPGVPVGAGRGRDRRRGGQRGRGRTGPAAGQAWPCCSRRSACRCRSAAWCCPWRSSP